MEYANRSRHASKSAMPFRYLIRAIAGDIEETLEGGPKPASRTLF